MAKTIEQRLQDAGYGHRQTPFSMNTGRHEIYRLDTGAVVGNYSAVESLEFDSEAPTYARVAERDAVTITIEFVPLAVIVRAPGVEFAVGLPLEWLFPGAWRWLESGVCDL